MLRVYELKKQDDLVILELQIKQMLLHVKPSNKWSSNKPILYNESRTKRTSPKALQCDL